MRIIYWKGVGNESPAGYRGRFLAAVQEGLEDVEAGLTMRHQSIPDTPSTP